MKATKGIHQIQSVQDILRIDVQQKYLFLRMKDWLVPMKININSIEYTLESQSLASKVILTN